MMGHCATWAAPNDLLRGAARWREAPTTNWIDIRAGAAKANPVVADSVFMVGENHCTISEFHCRHLAVCNTACAKRLEWFVFIAAEGTGLLNVRPNV